MALVLLAGCDAADNAADDEQIDSGATYALVADGATGEHTTTSTAGPGAVQPRVDATAPTAATAVSAAPPVGAAPATEPPTTETVATEPPVGEQPASEPPTSEPPTTTEVTEPPTTALPVPPPVPTPPLAPAATTTLQGPAAEFLDALNGLRTSLGLGPLSGDAALVASADAQVDVMLSGGTLAHQDLQDELAQGWMIVGENVGYGPNVDAIHQALVNSPGHYANLVNARFSRVGIVVKSDANGRLWVAQVFGG
ncbi:MAG: CAP domain-containing protein [Acidimicrobiales bacterium]|nr:CAP domain-containing protein [Acidimicrobiales bacterium]